MGKDGGRAESAATGVWNCETVAAYDPKAQSCTHRLGSRVGISSLGQGEMLAGGQEQHEQSQKSIGGKILRRPVWK